MGPPDQGGDKAGENAGDREEAEGDERGSAARPCLALPAVVFPACEDETRYLAFRTNGFNKGRAKGVTLMAAETHQGSPLRPWRPLRGTHDCSVCNQDRFSGGGR